jgi:glycosyltransferase involved in cell wall biosynthesis
MVKVSVVTVVKNHVSGLQTTHKSLLEQDLANWEMIIVVGNSEDGSLQIAQVLQLDDKRIRVIEQSKDGIYSAMNEGLVAATGDFIWFMNAGDKFATSLVLTKAYNEILLSETGIVIGSYRIENRNNQDVSNYSRSPISILNFAFNRRGGCHQAMIFRRAALNAIGGYDLSYSLASDFDLVLKIIKSEKAIRVSEVYASIEPGGLADQGIFTVHKEKHQIRRRLLGGPFIWITSILWTWLARIKVGTLRSTHPHRKS